MSPVRRVGGAQDVKAERRVLRAVISHCLAWIAVGAFVLQPALPAFAQDQAAVVTIDECRDLQDDAVRGKIREVAETSLKSELAGVDYAALVNAHWDKADVGAQIDREVDAAIEAVRADSSWLDRAYSNVSQSTAARFATAVADKAYNSEGFKSALAGVASGIAADIGNRLESVTASVASPVLACVRTALQSRYGGAVAQVFEQESQRNLGVSAEEGQARIAPGDLILTNVASISGIVLIVTRRVIGRMVAGMGRRIAGVVASRIVSSIAGLVGLALIAKDIYDAGEGVFPIIAERMKADDTKALIKNEIATSIQSDVTQQLGTIAQETAERIYSVWLDFRQKYQRLLTLAEQNEQFSAFLRDRKLDQLGKLGQIVDVIVASEGEEKVFTRVQDGSLNRALLDLTEPGLKIATDMKSIETALKWTELAGDRLERVADLGIYRAVSPDEISQDALAKLLALPDRGAVQRVAQLDAAARDAILSLPQAQIQEFARRMTEPQLAAFADYRRRLDPAASRRLLRAVTENPAVMGDLTSSGLAEAVLRSRDQLAALDMLIRTGEGLLSYGRIFRDAELVLDGTVSPRVFLERYWASVLVGAVVLLLFLLWLRRLIFGRAPTVIIRQDGRDVRR